jgi:hypothetical protein
MDASAFRRWWLSGSLLARSLKPLLAFHAARFHSSLLIQIELQVLSFFPAKRLEQGRFSWLKPSKAGQKRLSLTPEALTLLTDGIDLKGARMRPWYERE